MSAIWFTSDLHIGHPKVAGLRHFWNEDEVDDEGNAAPHTVEHDAILATNWDIQVSKRDTVYVLGDISTNREEHALAWLRRRPGTKHLITGNHDSVAPWNRRGHQRQKLWLETFETVQPFLMKKLAGREFLMSHFPYWSYRDGPERTTARYEQFRLPDLGMPLLHGHTHGTETAHDNMFHVGVDAHGMMLVPDRTIMSWLKGLPNDDEK